jgi:hypothetical protein
VKEGTAACRVVVHLAVFFVAASEACKDDRWNGRDNDNECHALASTKYIAEWPYENSGKDRDGRSGHTGSPYLGIGQVE